MLISLALAAMGSGCGSVPWKDQHGREGQRPYDGAYTGAYLNRVAFPIGGIGAGMFCLEGSGSFSHVSFRNRMDFPGETGMFAALRVQHGDNPPVARVLAGPVPDWKILGLPEGGLGLPGTNFGLPRFTSAQFEARFPFATVTLRDSAIPLHVSLCGWSPFTPGEPDRSSLPVGALEYTFHNTGHQPVSATFSFHSRNFMAMGTKGHTIKAFPGGFILRQNGAEQQHHAGAAAFFLLGDEAKVDHAWYHGGAFEPLTILWHHIEQGEAISNPPQAEGATGASLYHEFTLAPGASKTVRLLVAWYVPRAEFIVGPPDPAPEGQVPSFVLPWYAGQFKNVAEVARHWAEQYDALRDASQRFRDTFYDTTLPPEVTEAVAANLSILKSPTVLRQADGRLWMWEGNQDHAGSCHGSCTHVWNYAQATAHLFPSLERTLRETEFLVNQDAGGHQNFRAWLPIRSPDHIFYGAADGQLGGIVKVYREWRIGGDSDWLRHLWPNVRASLDYCIKTWDPQRQGVLTEPHHNTYDMEFWGPEGMTSTIYLAALAAAVEMGTALGDDVEGYRELGKRGRDYLSQELFNGEYFIQRVPPPPSGTPGTNLPLDSYGPGYRDTVAQMNREGLRYQVGEGCLSDGVLGCFLARTAGLENPVADPDQVRSHLMAVYRYNERASLADHANPGRPGYALGNEGGLLLCTWPRGNRPLLPMFYADEVWTGIEYQVAVHLMMEGKVEEGLTIVRRCRDRYDGRVRNPFNEYECGHWYGRALASYALLQGLTGLRYDAIDKTLNIDSQLGEDFRAFICTATGYGTAGLEHGHPFIEVTHGTIDIQKARIQGITTAIDVRNARN